MERSFVTPNFNICVRNPVVFPFASLAVLSLYSLVFYKWKIDFFAGIFFFHGYTVITERVNVGGFGEFGPCLPFLSGHLKVLICFLQLLLVLTIVSLKNCKRYSILCCVLGTY